mmetsp:Transcript_19859/g.64616  ORF Transcript_19859/g.64616 Transcript_19859/m.64616 type:complete len:206 (-) Transcript_19859:113-730(-)
MRALCLGGRAGEAEEAAREGGGVDETPHEGDERNDGGQLELDGGNLLDRDEERVVRRHARDKAPEVVARRHEEVRAEHGADEDAGGGAYAREDAEHGEEAADARDDPLPPALEPDGGEREAEEPDEDGVGDGHGERAAAKAEDKVGDARGDELGARGVAEPVVREHPHHRHHRSRPIRRQKVMHRKEANDKDESGKRLHPCERRP